MVAESLIKTEIAFQKSNGIDVILMEEPENHLSYSNLRLMLQNISAQELSAQIIVTTHSNMIASGLGLKNVLWIRESDKEGNLQICSLNNIDQEVSDFFIRSDNNSFLQLLLSKKVILVEGATEFLLIPHFYKQLTGRNIDRDGISVISCNGISYQRYLNIAQKSIGKRVAVITDNDGDQCKIDDAKLHNENSQNKLHQIFMGETVGDWTWEACLYRLNTSLLDEVIKVREGATYVVPSKEIPNVTLRKMLKNKVDSAYEIIKSGKEFVVPQYVKDAIKWISE